jgi:hypothetical protein
MLCAALIAATVVQAPAQAATRCGLTVGSVTSAGDHKFQRITATSPVTAGVPAVGPKGLFPAGQVRLAGAVGWEPDPPSGMGSSGYVTMANDLYSVGYVIDQTSGELDPDSYRKRRIGGGWTPEYRYLEESKYSYSRTNTYALRDGVISRWTVDGITWRNKATYQGFSAVKTMTLISQTSTYDTFLANTYGGALYTIRIPVAGAPVVKKVRASTWQAFDTLIAERCGTQSTLLLGIDKDTRTGHLYAISHATGPTTVIQGLGKIPTTFTDHTYFRHYPSAPEAPKLYGE